MTNLLLIREKKRRFQLSLREKGARSNRPGEDVRIKIFEMDLWQMMERGGLINGLMA